MKILYRIGIPGIILSIATRFLPFSSAIWHIGTALGLISIVCIIIATLLFVIGYLKRHRKISKRRKVLLCCMAVFLLGQMLVFRDYISPFLWGKLRVENVWWTGADASVKAGELYLSYITPDSLKSKDMYYSEVYLVDQPGCNRQQSMRYDTYIVKGKVVGQRMGADRPSPIVQIEYFKTLPEFDIWGLRTIFTIELIAFGIATIFILKRKTK